MPSLILVGDVNLMNVENSGVPFARIGETLRAADLVFANLECLLYEPPDGHAVEHEGFFADPEIAGEALRTAGIATVGLANNVNYGAAAILGSLARLDRLGIRHTGAGPNLAAAPAPAIADCGRRRHRDRAGAALLAAGRDLSRQADLLWPRQLLIPYRPWRPPARRLDRHDGAMRDRARRRDGRPLPLRAPQSAERNGVLQAG